MLNLRDVRAASRSGFDRLVIEFAAPSQPPPIPVAAGTLPEYQLNRVSRLVRDASGEPVQIQGRDLYSLVFRGARGFEMVGENPVKTYASADEIKPNLKILKEVEKIGDFEANLSFGLGLAEPRCPRVAELKNPLRLVIDIPK